MTQPYNSKYIKLISQQINHPGLRLLSHKDPEHKHDQLARAYTTGTVQLSSTYVLQASQEEPFASPRPRVELTTEQREFYLKGTPEIDLESDRLKAVSVVLTRQVSDQQSLLRAIFNLVRQYPNDEDHRFNQIEHVLKEKRATILGRARLMVALCRLNNIPARINTGFMLTASRSAQPVYWVGVYDEENGWTPYAPEHGFAASLPKSYVLFNRGYEYLFDVRNGELLNVSYSIEEDIFTLGNLRHASETTLLDIMDLRRLDIETRNALALLLLLPLGVLISSFCRHVLGLFPYGTFTATLLALAIVYTDAITGATTTGIVILLASLGRAIMPDSLTRVPRLSIIFTFVAMAMVLSVSVLDYYDLNTSGHIVLLPIVILTSLVDRFYSYWDSDGMHSAMVRLAVTVVIALLIVPVLQLNELGHLLLRYPELHLYTAALMLGFSAYSRKKLTDFGPLRLLGENKLKKKKSRKRKSTSTPPDVNPV